MSLYDPFAAVYDQWFPLTDDVPFYVELARETEGPLVELPETLRPLTFASSGGALLRELYSED